MGLGCYNNHIRLDSDSKSSVSSAVGMRVAPDWHSPSLTQDYVGHEVVSLIDDSNSEREVYNSLDKRASSLDSFYALLSYDNGKKDHTEVPMPPPILTET